MAILSSSRKTNIPYEMFDVARSASEAKRYARCERIYHKGQELAWDGKEILPMLLEKHGGIHLDDEKREALKQLFAIILWGELAAWRISAQLADRIEPLEAKMAATSQSFDEARHFYTMYDYLTELGYTPERLDRAPEALLDLTLDTENLANKLLGMQLLIETIALTIFQEVRERAPEPVIAELMKYYERDEARHVGLGMQYLPELMKKMSPRELSRLFLFQARLITLALWETKVLEKDLRTLGIDPRHVVERTKNKQGLALKEAFASLGWTFDDRRNPVLSLIGAGVEFMFPREHAKGRPLVQARLAWEAFKEVMNPADDALDVHAGHAIKTARGKIAEGEARAVPAD